MIRQAISPRLAIKMRLNIKRNALCHSRWKWLRIAGDVTILSCGRRI